MKLTPELMLKRKPEAESSSEKYFGLEISGAATKYKKYTRDKLQRIEILTIQTNILAIEMSDEVTCVILSLFLLASRI